MNFFSSYKKILKHCDERSPAQQMQLSTRAHFLYSRSGSYILKHYSNMKTDQELAYVRLPTIGNACTFFPRVLNALLHYFRLL